MPLETIMAEVMARLPRPIARGIVTAVTGAGPYYADVKLDGAGAATPQILCASGYTPAVNDYVVVLQWGHDASDRLVLAKIPV